MAKATCSIDGCEKEVLARGWCAMHYQRWRQHGDPNLGARKPSPDPKPCAVDGCDRLAHNHKRQLCRRHYKRWIRHGDPTAGRKLAEGPYNGARCREDGCERLTTKRGWCDTHYTRWRLHGDPRWPAPTILRHVPADPTAPRLTPKPLGTRDAAWLAGLFEGEGSITIEKDRFVKLVLGMTDRDVVARVHELVPSPSGPLFRRRGKAHHKDQWIWYISRPVIVEAALRAMLPWFGQRRRTKALEALYVLAYRHPGSHGHFHKAKTRCPQGHLYDEANTYVDPRTGGRTCKTCRRETGRRYARKARAARAVRLAQLTAAT